MDRIGLVDPRPSWTQASDCSLLARFPGLSHADAGTRTARLFHAILAANISGINNLQPSYESLLVVYSVREWSPASLVTRLEEAARQNVLMRERRAFITIPICCAAKFALDLDEVSARAGLSADAAVQLFTAGVYRVAFLGFAPGFPYLQGLPAPLATPRLLRPRTRVSAGSVGIAGRQAGIYPADTPGGWRIIGRTPFRLFDIERAPMSLLLPGDEVRFSIVDESSFEDLSRQ